MAKKMRVRFKDKRRRKCVATITAAMEPCDHASEGAALADRLYNHAPGATVDHMLLRILGRMAGEPDHVTSVALRSTIRALQAGIAAR